MFDTMTLTKIVGAFCGTLLVFLLGNWAGETLYHVSEEAHEGEEIHQAYAIPLPEGDEVEVVEDVVPFAEVYAAADASAGERIWNQCRGCHVYDNDANINGPHLVGVVGRPQGAVDGYSYSSAFAELAGEWSPEELNGFLENPVGWVPGTRMNYSGLDDVEDRANLIAFLEANAG